MKNNQSRNISSSRLALGLILIALGVLYFLDNIDVITFDFGHVLFSWPMFITVIGLIILLNSRNRFFGTLLLFIGLFFLLPRIFPELHYNSGIIWPILIIILGVSILVKRGHHWHDDAKGFFPGKKQINLDKFDEAAVFGGGEKLIRSDNFKGGNLLTIFGGLEIDLSQCKLADGDNYIDVLAIFGGTTLVVPKEWNVRVDILPIFGGFGKKGYRMSEAEIDRTRSLIIKGTVIFGGGEIKYV